MAQHQVFPAASSARREISRNAYLLFGAGAALLICGASGLGITFAGENVNALPLALAGGVLCAGLAGLLAGLTMLTRLKQHMQVEVTPYRLVWREGRRIATLEFDEVVRVEIVRDARRTRRGTTYLYPLVRFIENDGEVMEFEVTFEDRGHIHLSRFDARAIAAAVLPHLPPHVVISPTLHDFIQSGEVDIDLLPER
jgi:uncharacterized protein (DUF58 family)